MVAKQLWVFLALVALPVGLAGQEPTVISLIPTDNWQLRSSTRVDFSAVEKWGGDPAIEREYGVKALDQRTYQFGNLTANVLVEQTSDPSLVYGLFTYYRTTAMAAGKGIALALTWPGGAMMARGRQFIRVAPAPGSHLTASGLSSLLISLGGTKAAADATPSLPTPLPGAGLISGSEKYVLGPEAFKRLLPSISADLIGFSQGAEAELGMYKLPGSGSASQPATVVTLTYPTPQIARARYSLIDKALGLNQERGSHRVFGERVSSFVILVVDADSSAVAKKLLDEFHGAQAVSWDQPPPTTKPLAVQLAQLILANFLLIFILVSFSVVGGIIIVLTKRLIRKWFPESSLGRVGEERLITLNLR